MYEAILWRKNRWEKLVQSFYRIIPHSIFPSALSGLVCKDANDVGFIASLRGDYSSLITLTVRKFYWCSNCFSLPDFTPIAPSHKFPQAIQDSYSPSWVFWAKQYTTISFNLSLKSIYMMDAAALERLQAWRQPLVTALCPHKCTHLCAEMVIPKILTPDRYPLTYPAFSCKWISFSVRRKAKAGNPKERWIHRISTKVGRDPRRSLVWMANYESRSCCRRFAQMGLKSPQNHTFPCLSQGPVWTLHFVTEIFFSLAHSQKLVLYLVVL